MTGFQTRALAAVPPRRDRAVRRARPGLERRETLRLCRLARIRTHVEMMLFEPDLSARQTARAVGVSVRSLHSVLALGDETFAVLVQRRRLEACHALLQDGGAGRSIADIAFACGFNSLSSFYRGFHRTFGICPRALDTQVFAALERR